MKLETATEERRIRIVVSTTIAVLCRFKAEHETIEQAATAFAENDVTTLKSLRVPIGDESACVWAIYTTAAHGLQRIEAQLEAEEEASEVVH